MAKISELSDDLLVKILSFLPTKVAVSTSALSKQWEFLWMWSPKIEYDDYEDITNHSSKSSLLRYHNFIYKSLPLHRAPVIESMRLSFYLGILQPEYFKSWVEIAVSSYVRELSIKYSASYNKPEVLLPSSLYNCNSFVSLKLEGWRIIVDVPRTVCFPSLKKLQLGSVTYQNKDSLQLLLSNCYVLEELIIERVKPDDVRALVVTVPSLHRLSLYIDYNCSSDAYVIVTPSLKYFKVEDYRESFSYLIEHMPKLEEAHFVFLKNPDQKLLDSVTSVKLLSLDIQLNSNEVPVYHAGIVFKQLEHLNLCISRDYWSKSLVRLLTDAPKLRELELQVPSEFCTENEEYQPEPDIDHHDLTSLEGVPVPTCLLKSLQTFSFSGYKARPEERDFLSFIFKNAHCLTSSSIWN